MESKGCAETVAAPLVSADSPRLEATCEAPVDDCKQEPSDIVATEVTICATPEPTVSSLISSSLQTVHGGELERVEGRDTWDEVAAHCDADVGRADDDHGALQHEQAVSQPLEPYHQLPEDRPVQLSTTAEPSDYTSAIQNTNNSNSCAIVQSLHDGPPGGVTFATTEAEPPKKRAKYIKPNSAIEITLEGRNLWEEFCRRGTEMIVNRSGRRMFPGFSVAVSGLKPKVKYSMKLEVVLADNHRFKFLNARWLAVGTAEPQPLSESYIHPDSPNSGAFWMRHGISFRKLKITNNKERPGNNALLHSMHKYFLRLIIDEERKTPPGEDKLPARTVLQLDFPETTFIAVTAYQNEEVTQLKITNNPFAKAFRDNAADIDWDTAQMLYSQQQGYTSPGLFQQYSEHYGSQMVAPGSWPLPSPLLPPTPLTASLPPISPFTGHRGPPGGYLTPSTHYPYSSTACLSGAPAAGSQPLSAHGNTAPGYFHWPATGRHAPQQGIPTSSHDIYEQYSSNGSSLYTYQHAPSNPGSNLPDFDSVFTSSLGPHTTQS